MPNYLKHRLMDKELDDAPFAPSDPSALGNDFVGDEEPAKRPELEDEEPEEAVQAEPEAEAEELPDPEIDEKGEDEKDDKGLTIPKARFDQAVGKYRAREQELLDRLAALEAGVQPTATDDKDIQKLQTQMEEMTQKYEDMLVDGEKDKAREIRRERDALSNRIQQLTIAQLSQQSRTQAVEDVRYENTLDMLEERYSMLNPKSEDYDKTLVGEVAELMNAYAGMSGYTRTSALKKAVSLLVEPLVKQTGGVPAAKKDTEGLRQQRAEEARKKTAAAVTKQPAQTGLAGKDNKTGISAADVLRMSQEEFDKLGDEELAKLRGDRL